MLVGTNEASVRPIATALQCETNATSEAADGLNSSNAEGGRVTKVLSVEWLGQTTASVCWIASVFTYGISSTGDWLQLAAASAWLLANLAAFFSSEAD